MRERRKRKARYLNRREELYPGLLLQKEYAERKVRAAAAQEWSLADTLASLWVCRSVFHGRKETRYVLSNRPDFSASRI
jgi:hypothetical protein